MNDSPWYDAGLRFECTQCGNCCGGGPGTIRVNDDEIARLAERLGLSEDSFRERYTHRLRGGDISLNEQDNYDCIFFRRDSGCSVYTDRPRQCRTWPFWHSVVLSEETWSDAVEGCPGMNSGNLFDSHEITTTAADDGTSATRPRGEA